jgi:3-oxoadipate enol-lactonase
MWIIRGSVPRKGGAAVDPHGLAARALRTVFPMPRVESVPEGRMVELPGRGRTFVVDVPGPPGAPTLVLLHALVCTGYLAWHPVLEQLTGSYRVVLLDQRWHGRGIRSPQFRLEDCADDVAALLDVLEIERCIPVGYSMGGAIAQLLWERHPARVEGLVLCATARNFKGTRRERLFFPVVQTAMAGMAGYCAQRVERVAGSLPELPTTTAGDTTWGRAEFRSTSAWAAPAVLAELGRFNSSPWIGEVDVPTAVVVTTRDRTIPARRQRRLAACIPGAEVVEVDGGHASLVLGAEQFAPGLMQAVRSVERRSESTAVRQRASH